MRKFLAITMAACGMAISPLPAIGATAPNAFVGAQGFGASALGGRLGDVYHVTNLSDSGPGSLRYGIENAPRLGRTIVFDVGGWIDLDSKLGVLNDRITIAGQTAPGGIGVRGDQFSIGASDIVIRHMRFRPGKRAGRVDAAGANIDADRIIYDHVSAGFSYDETFSTRAGNLTLQYSSVSWGMEDHSAGSLIENGAGNLTFHHNVYAHNDTRNPKARAQIIDWRDNVAYDYHNGFIAGSSTTTDFYWRANFDGNTYIGGSANRPMITGGRDWNYGLWFGTNDLDADGDNVADVTTIDRAIAMDSQSIVSSSYTWETHPFAAPEVWQNGSAAEAYEWTLDHFGATPWNRDAVDALTVSNVRNRAGSRVSHENQLGIENAGYPTLGGLPAPLDTDRDGMPDEWELAHGKNPLVVDHLNDYDQDGYTDLEEYLMQIAPFPAPGPITHLGGTQRYAEAQGWAHFWQPSPLDTASIGQGTVVVDAIGQHAGTLRIGTRALDAASLRIDAGHLRVTDEIIIGEGSGVGTLSVLGGELAVDRVTRGPQGSLILAGGELRAREITFGFTNQGSTLAPLDPTGSFTVLGDLTLDTGTVVLRAVGGPTDAFGRVMVDGLLTPGGTLAVNFDSAPSLGDTFALLEFDARVGDFDGLAVTGLGTGLDAVLTYTATRGWLQIVQNGGAPGDYNANGRVDQADLDLVLNNWGREIAASGLPLGWISDLPSGAVDQAELDAVLQHWGGSTAPELSGSRVPEPSLGSAVLGLVCLSRTCRARMRQH